VPHETLSFEVLKEARSMHRTVRSEELDDSLLYAGSL